MINSDDFANRLEKLMTYYDLTATALAEKVAFNRSSISHLISGRNKPSLEFVLKILENFDAVSWEWLVLGKGSFPKNESDSAVQLEAKTQRRTFSDELVSTFDTPSPPFDQTILDSEIDRIVILYKNGTFKSYNNR